VADQERTASAGHAGSLPDLAITGSTGQLGGLAARILRDNFYLDFLPLMVGEDGVIRGPAGDGVMAAVTRGDIANWPARRRTFMASPAGNRRGWRTS
jgi:hypothetical protein